MGLWGRIVTILLKKKYIYHIQDVHPECLYFSGALKNKFLFRFLRYIDRKNVDQSVATVTLSLDMKEELVSRGCQSDKIFIVNNPAQSEFSPFDDLDLPLEFPTDKFVILFAGNMGKYQNLGLIVEAAKSLRHNDQIIFVFMGDGTARNDLKEQAGDCVGKNVRFIPYQQPEVAGKAMQIASLGLVSLQSSITRFAYPSKIPTLLCHGCPILALIEDDSEIFNMIVKNRLGYVVQSRDPQEIADFIENIWEKNELSDIKNKDFRERVEDIFGFDTIMAKWEDVFDLMR
jgi:glycosyltransferase involved in cell wall biosynthesis